MKQGALLCWSRWQSGKIRGLDTSKVRSSRSFNVRALGNCGGSGTSARDHPIFRASFQTVRVLEYLLIDRSSQVLIVQ